MAIRFRLVNNQKFRKDKDGNIIPPKDKRSYLYLCLQEHSKKLRYSTGIKLLPEYWNQEKQVPRKSHNGVSLDNYQEIKGYLNALKSFTEKLYFNLKVENGIVDFTIIREELNKRFKGKKIEVETQKEKISLFNFLDIYIEESKLTKATGTVKKYIGLKNILIEFGKLWRPIHPVIDFEDITMDWYYSFLQYLKEVRKYKKNTYGKTIKLLKAVLNNATTRGVNTNLIFRNKLFKSFQEEVKNIYLTEDDIKKIYELNLTAYKAGYTTVRDLFIIGCCTGLRFSDIKRVKKDNINNGIIELKTQKTSTEVAIPLNSMAIMILEKYNYCLPIALSNQKTNEYLKEIGKVAGIDTPILISDAQRNLNEKVSVPKYTLIKTHTARRSFATNAYLAEIDVLAIRKMTGHKDDKSFYNYIKIGVKQNADNYRNHPHFN